MKKIFFLLTVAVIFAACKNSQNNGQTVVEPNETTEKTTSLSIAVVNSDSIILNYAFAVNAQESLTRKAEDARLSLNTKARQLSNEMADFQKKYENNAFLSRERAESEANRLQKKQTDLQEHSAKLENDFMVEQSKLGQQLKDSIELAIKELNKGRFSLVLSTNSMNDNVLYSDEALNITKEVLAFLNKRYK
ncbi:MAG: OmpH family outer membrane protein [Prevotellaceae bacterium]|jgi:outer membrane protein|nr:OmpH family outer membrane protein [Prevotellaceae bacterium]